jgi:glycosyltransferase involved in cell wall biosynthesis
MLNFSIIICTYNRASLLEKCLESLAQQDLSESEVIIVDNNSKDDTEKVIQRFITLYSNFRGLKETNQGLSFARNCGMNAANSDWIIFLDDDCYVDPSYTKFLREEIKSNEFRCIGGVYLPWYKEGKKNWYKDSYGSNLYKRTTNRELIKDQFADGGNIIFYKPLLLELGGFNTRLGMKEDSLSYGEETEIQVKMRKIGHKIGLNENLIIHHLVPLKKQSFRWIIKSAFANGETYWKTFMIKPTKIKIIKISLGAIPEIGHFFYKLILDILTQRQKYIKNSILEGIIPLSYRLGKIISGIKEL